MKHFNKFWLGFVVGIMLPAVFIVIYLKVVYPDSDGLIAILSRLFPSEVFGKLLILSIFPNLLLCFTFYKTDSFNIAIGSITGSIPYLIASFFML